VGDDLIGTVELPIPLLDKAGVVLSYKTARYRISVQTVGAPPASAFASKK
jgi:hypothetical protein